MDRYFCDQCGEEFNEPYESEEHHPYGSTTAVEHFSSSPCCDAGYNEGKCCAKCVDMFSSTDSRDYCPDCVEEAVSFWNEKSDQEKFAICIAYIQGTELSLYDFLDDYLGELIKDPINTTITKFAISYVLPDAVDDEFIEFLVQTNEI